jgi:hypothetical protein
MYAIRKADLKSFQPRSQDVCRIEDGSTNAYLREDRAIEEFLRTVEPNYSNAVEKLEADSIDSDAIYPIAGFVAYVISCSPAAMRIGTAPARMAVELSARALDAAGELPVSPSASGGETLSEMLADGKVSITVDPKYPQAIGIAGVLDSTRLLGNFRWEILSNPHVDCPFFTSDFPVAIEFTNDVRVFNRLVPLTPTLALRICSDVRLRREDCDLSFSRFEGRRLTVSRPEAIALNRALVQCAETTVFYRDDLPWVNGFVARNRKYRIEPQVHEIPHGTGTMMIATQRIVAGP